MKIKTIEELKKLMKDLGASEETTSDGFTFIELDSKNLKCPEASKGCKPHGWPKGNPKWTKQQAIQETVPYNDIEEATSDDK